MADAAAMIEADRNELHTDGEHGGDEADQVAALQAAPVAPLSTFETSLNHNLLVGGTTITRAQHAALSAKERR